MGVLLSGLDFWCNIKTTAWAVEIIGGFVDMTKNKVHGLYTDGDMGAFFFIKLPPDEAKTRYDTLKAPFKKELSDGYEENKVVFGYNEDWAIFADYAPEYNKIFVGVPELNVDLPMYLKLAKNEEAIFAMYGLDDTSAFIISKEHDTIKRMFYDFGVGSDEDCKNEGILPYEKTQSEGIMDVITLIDTLIGRG